MKNKLLSILLILTLSANVNAQNSVEETAKNALIIGRTLPQEHVYLQFDNSVYYLGETIWFKAYTTYSNNDQPSIISKVLYVELVAPEGYIIETKKYKLDENGCCHGEFELNKQLLSGYYEVRAYTRYMLNRGDEAIFSRVFPIFDKVNKNNWDFKNIFDRERVFLTENNKKEDAKLTFYPEGGHLVNGIKSLVAYELRDLDGNFTNDTISIYKNEHFLLHTAPIHNGKGSFYITPDNNAKYRAEVYIKNKKGKKILYKFRLPEIEKEGIATHIKQSEDSIYIDIKNNCNSITELGFVLLHRGSIGLYNKFSSEEKCKTFKIDKKSLPEGVCRAVIFTNDIPLAERQFFVQHKEIQDGDRETVKLNVRINSKDCYDFTVKPYEKINISVEREDNKPINRDAEFAISVTDASGHQVTSWDYNLYTYLLLGSELKGYIPNASQYFDKNNKNRTENLDLVMLTHGWTAYDWNLLNNLDIRNIKPVEKELLLKGSLHRIVTDNKGNNKVINEAYNPIRLDVSYTGDSILTSVFRTDSLGNFMIALDDFYDKHVAYLSPKVIAKFNDNIKYTFYIDKYFSPKLRELDYWEKSINKPAIEYIDENINKNNYITKISHLEYLLGDVEIIEKRKSDIYSRPPMCEIKFNYLDEWEYAKDITYFKGDFSRNLAHEEYELEVIRRKKLEEIAEAEIAEKDTTIFMEEEAITMYDRFPQFKTVITANNVLRSIFKRYNLPWCFWVHSIVPVGEYDSNSVPIEDMDYLHGKDAEKMTNFKEIIIRGDEKICKSIENSGEGFWKYKSNAISSKTGFSEFYEGFLSPTTIYPRTFEYDNLINRMKESMRHPNYVACFIPFKNGEKREGIIPEFTNSYSVNRYTTVQGYAKSKEFYSPDYSKYTPIEDRNDYRRTLLWEPNASIKDGKITLELYNSEFCEYININVNGKDNTTYYSNDNITETRVLNRTENNNKAKKNIVKRVDMVVDSVALEQYEEEYKLGVAYYNMKKYINAVKIFAELQQYNYTPAIRSIGYCYLYGNGLKMDENSAIEFFMRAAELGDAESMYELALIYKKRDSTKNRDIILKLIKEAAEKNEPRAFIDLGKYYIKEHGDSVKGIYYYRLAAINKVSYGEYLYANYMIENSIENDDILGNSIELMTKAAKREQQDAMLYLVQYYDKREEYSEAYNWAKKLHLLNNKKGTAYMARCYELGLGVKKDKVLSRDLYRIAK